MNSNHIAMPISDNRIEQKKAEIADTSLTWDGPKKNPEGVNSSAKMKKKRKTQTELKERGHA